MGARSCLTAHRGKLLSGMPGRGTPVHAATFVRRREIVLETELLTRPELPLIFAHECLHFLWPRLGNPARASFRALLQQELQAHARGEVGESATVRKDVYLLRPRPETFRDYICESFCDTGAWYFIGEKNNGHLTLADRWRRRRREWMAAWNKTLR